MGADRRDADAGDDGGVPPALDPEKLMRLRVTACGEALARVTDAGEELELAIAALNLRMLAATSAANEAARTIRHESQGVKPWTPSSTCSQPAFIRSSWTERQRQ